MKVFVDLKYNNCEFPDNPKIFRTNIFFDGIQNKHYFRSLVLKAEANYVPRCLVGRYEGTNHGLVLQKVIITVD